MSENYVLIQCSAQQSAGGHHPSEDGEHRDNGQIQREERTRVAKVNGVWGRMNKEKEEEEEEFRK